MFQLIIAVLAIALIAALAIASLYYGGSAFSNGSAKAAASTVVSQAQQVNAADVLFQNDNAGAYATDIAALVSANYLKAAPVLTTNIGGTTGWSIDSTDGMVYTDVANEQICTQINQQVGVSTNPSATDGTPASLNTAITAQYGCAVVAGVSPNPDTYFFAYH